mmetsp:Transcript_41520/g.74838  ORF Transcript_41520/g.74838 Transcript_41520/m.74838 type:complete len:103 (-) Transcript_41520:312-620(-)|eukprot:CAMPEP_0201894472 /NCGR_PEP_ID=MMETSP0902-20130614/40788_1 /ASSEMBLY_ACC=CAM_ASM_000551 /TAXON_ID=420261 /ORGANISM="Thalassiosira antarctica, Strain CCMP982" /LENGTH=102 /DNA_ID=CAMNT_0048426527 /DNA_START=266 /DNA_END=574 /DNA_ORIENTATION=-
MTGVAERYLADEDRYRDGDYRRHNPSHRTAAKTSRPYVLLSIVGTTSLFRGTGWNEEFSLFQGMMEWSAAYQADAALQQKRKVKGYVAEAAAARPRLELGDQ